MHLQLHGYNATLFPYARIIGIRFNGSQKTSASQPVTTDSPFVEDSIIPFFGFVKSFFVRFYIISVSESSPSL